MKSRLLAKIAAAVTVTSDWWNYLTVAIQKDKHIQFSVNMDTNLQVKKNQAGQESSRFHLESNSEFVS